MRPTVLLALLVLPAACYEDPQRFNQRQAKLLCKLEGKCGDHVYVVGETEVALCGPTRGETLDRCAEVCEYDSEAAVLCARALRKALRPALFGPDCGLDDEGLDVCSDVYVNCEPDPGEEVECSLPDGQLRCTLGGTSPPTITLLLLLPWIARRRRCRCSNSMPRVMSAIERMD